MSKSGIEESISNFHSDSICYATKTVKIFGDIDEEMKDRTISNLHMLDQTTGTVTILLSSHGGDVMDGLAIMDAIRAMKNNVRIIVYGQAYSMASAILQAADKGMRYMMPNAALMLHEGLQGVIDDRKKSKKEWERLQKKNDEKVNSIYLQKIKQKKPRFSMPKLEQEMEKDWILTAEEAVEFGLADEILEVY